MATETIALHELHQDGRPVNGVVPDELAEQLMAEQDHVNESQLPPVDGGKDAWLFLAACFVIEALVWGKEILSFSRRCRN